MHILIFSTGNAKIAPDNFNTVRGSALGSMYRSLHYANNVVNSDAIYKSTAKYVADVHGEEGVIREAAEMILSPTAEQGEI